MEPEDYRAARETAAAAELPWLGRLVFRGPDRQRFLHGLLSSDVLGLQPGQSAHTCVLTPKGKLVADFFLYNRGEELLALCRRAQIPGIRAALSKALPLSKTTVEEGPAGGLYLQGPRAREVVQAIGRESLPFTSWSPDGVLLEQAPPLSALQEAGIRALSPEILEVLRVEAGVAEPRKDYDAETYPLEVGLESAISFSKGCFMGQESIAHIKYRGHLNRRLSGVRLEAEAAAGSDVLAGGQTIGRAGTVVRSPRLGCWLGLALLRTPHDAPGTRLEVADSPAETVALPL